MSHSQCSTLEKLEEIEQSYPNDMENDEDDPLGVLHHVGRARRVSIWSPESRQVRVSITLQELEPSDINLEELELTPEDSRSSSGTPELPARCPETPRIPQAQLLSANALRIQEVRKFLSVPESIPTRSIPAFFKNHLRVTNCLNSGVFLTRGSLSPKRPYVWVVGADQERMNEIRESLQSIEWEDDQVSEPESCASSETSATVSDVGSSSRFFDNLIGLDEEDEIAFWQAVNASRVDTTKLVEVEQRPRLQLNPDSPCRVSEPSPLRKEVFVRSDDGLTYCEDQ
ncbi:hypothetical protein ACEPPN_007120 [Leptodophora sp. 'Broadleaf-Isolate-01']